MSWLRENRKVGSIVAFTLAVPVTVLIYLVISLWTLGQSAQREIDSLEPRIARLQGAQQAQEQLLEAARQVDARILNLVYPATDDPDTVSATLQKNVRGIMSRAGLVVADSRIESTRREGAFDVVGLTVSVTGGIDALDAALLELVAYTPLLLVTDLNIVPARSGRQGGGDQEEQILTVKMHLLALRGVE